MKRPSGSRRVRKSCPLTAPKPSAKNAVDSRVAKVGLPSSRTCVGINVRRAWRTVARGAAKPWEPSGPAVCKTSVAYLRKQSKLLHYFSPGGKNFADKRPPFWGPETDPKTGAKSSGHKQIKLRLNEWPPFWGPFLDPKTGAVLSAKFWSPGEKQQEFRLFLQVRDRSFPRRCFSMVLQRRRHLFAKPCEHLWPHMFLNWGGPLWRDRFLLGFLDPKLVSRKITFFDPLKEQKVWKTCEG